MSEFVQNAKIKKKNLKICKNTEKLKNAEIEQLIRYPIRYPIRSVSKRTSGLEICSLMHPIKYPIRSKSSNR